MTQFSLKDQVCYISGELTQNEVIKLWPQRNTLISDTTEMMDLSQLAFVDSAGLAFLITLWQEYQQQGKKLIMMSPSTQVKNLIELYNLQSAFSHSLK